jgi:hypothetical protein
MLVCLAGCGGSSHGSLDGPLPSPSPTGAVSQSRLEAMLLQSSDLAGLGARRAFASAGMTTQATPQLALCRAAAAVGPHELANVIADAARPGGVKIFELVSVFAGEAAAKAAFARVVADAHACTTYSSGGVGHRITQLSSVDVGAGAEAVHYALVTSDVVSGDVRTVARRGSVVVLISGFGAPPTKQPLLDYQADLMRKALARVG